MNFVKKASKYLVVGLLAFTIVRPLVIPRLPPVERMADAVEIVDFK